MDAQQQKDAEKAHSDLADSAGRLTRSALQQADCALIGVWTR